MRQRIISAIIALGIVLPIIYVGGMIFQILVLLIGILSYKEIVNLFTKNIFNKISCYLSLITIILSNFNKTHFDNILDFQVMGIIIILFAIMSLYNYKDKKFDVIKGFSLMGFTIALGLTFSAFMIIRNLSLGYIIYLLLISILTDIFSQVVGLLIGKNKLNEISPNKTWEGFIGGICFSVLISSLFYIILINSDINIFLLVIITTFLSLIGQLGDLFFSLIKRHYKIKDFSNIMPGHGGILDRLDSIIFIMLAFLFFIKLF